MANQPYYTGATDVELSVRAFNSSGSVTVAHNEPTLVYQYRRAGGALSAAQAMASLASVSAAHTDNGWIVKAAGSHRFCPPDLPFASPWVPYVEFFFSGVSGVEFDVVTVDLGNSDPRAAAATDYATSSALATVSTKIDTVDDLLDSEMPAVTASLAALTTAVDNVPTNAELATALTGMSTLTAAGVRTAVGLASANLDTQLGGLSTLNAAGVRSAVGLASANLDTQLDNIPTNTEFTNALTAQVTSIRNAILSWEPFSGYSLARLFRIKGALDRGTTSGRQGSTETITDPTSTVVVTVNYDSDNNRTSMSDNASNTP